MHPGQETTSFSMGKGEREGGCTEHHANSVWDQPRARARRRERRGEGTGPSFGRETANRSGSPRLFLHPACDHTPTSVLAWGLIQSHSRPVHRAPHLLDSSWGDQNLNQVDDTSTRALDLHSLLRQRQLSLPTSSLMYPWLVARLADTTETTAQSKQGTVFCLISELKRTTV